jgi:polyisoprenoid-binding protein YceI
MEEIMPSRSVLAVVALGAVTLAAPALSQEVYVFDARHTVPTFEVVHMGFSQQHGAFTDATGKVTLDRAAKKGTIDVTIATASVIAAPVLLKALKSEDLLNVEKFPTMTYKSGDLLFDGDNVTGANGDLTLLGVTKPVALKVTSFKCAPNPFNKKQMCGGEATATLKRSDFGMKYALPLAASDDVKIVIPFEAVKE